MWDKSYGTGNSWACAMAATTDGGYAVAGIEYSTIRLVKVDAFGDTEWDKMYVGAGGWVSSMVATYDGGCAIAGYKYVSGVGYVGLTDFWLVKVDAAGNMEWNRTYGGQGYDMARSLVATSDGGYAMAGTTNGSWGAFWGDVWLVKTDAAGNMQWNKTYAGTAGNDVLSLVAAPDGGYAIAGGNLLVKTDASGNMQWNVTFEQGSVHSMVNTSGGGYAVAGAYGDTNETWLLKTDVLGNMLWNKTYGATEYNWNRLLVATSDGGYAIAGGTLINQTPYGVIGDAWLLKTDAFGNVEWNQTYGGAGWDWPCSVVEVADGGYAVAGVWNCTGFVQELDFYAPPIFHGDFWLLKTDENGVVPEYSSLLVPVLALAATALLILKAGCKRRCA